MRIKGIILFIFCLIISVSVSSQTVIVMEKLNDVFVMPCIVNGLSLKFYFDTGASNVSISLTEAIFMLKNGYLSKEDLIGTEYYKIANGNIEEGTKIVLRQISIGNYNLYNVQASVIHDLDAPLLLGQSALSKLGKIQIDYSNNTLTIYNEVLKKSENDVKECNPENISVNEQLVEDYEDTPNESIISYECVSFKSPIGWSVEKEEIEQNMAYYIRCESKEANSSEIFSISVFNSELDSRYMIQRMLKEFKKSPNLKKANFKDIIPTVFNGIDALNADFDIETNNFNCYGRIICFNFNGKTILLAKQAGTLRRLEFEFKTIENSLKIE